MFQLRPGLERGHANHGWLDSYHSFSFADYYDPSHMGFSALRVINEDRVAPGAGFPTHGHRDMEIITYLLDGVLEHRDNMGNGSIIHPGEVQRMSAGTGVRHSEYNPSATHGAHFLQIWIEPDRQNVMPAYEQKRMAPETMHNRLRLLASPNGADDSVTIHQDARLYACRLENSSVTATLAPGRRAYVQVARGAVHVNKILLQAGDGARVQDESAIELTAQDAEVLLFDLP